MPKISVIIPAYNQAKYLPDALDCLLTQTYTDWECIIVNDGSTDKTEEVSHKYCKLDDRFKYIYKKNGGLSSARNVGIEMAKGEYLNFLDSDDILKPNMLEETINVAAKFQSDVTYCGWENLDRDLHEILRTNLPVQKKDYIRILMNRSICPCHAVLLKKSILEKTGVFDGTLKSCEDWDLWLRIAKVKGTFMVVSKALVGYRMSQATMSRNHMIYFNAVKTVLERARSFDYRIDLKDQTWFNNKNFPMSYAITPWILLTAGVAIVNERIDDAFTIFKETTSKYAIDIVPKNMKGLITYLTFDRKITEVTIKDFFKNKVPYYLLFLKKVEEYLKKPGFAWESFFAIFNQFGIHERVREENISAKDLVKFAFIKFKKKLS